MKREELFNYLLLAALIIGAVFVFSRGLPAAPPTAQSPGDDLSAQAALGTTFTYQGFLQQSGTPVNGAAQCDGQFSLFDAATGGTQLGSTQTIVNIDFNAGYFTVDLNGAGQFGPTAFDGQARFLEIAVRCPAGSGAFTDMGRQALNAAPYAFHSQSTGALQGRTVSATTPITGQVLEWNGTQCAPATDDVAGGGRGDITGVLTGTGLIGGGLSGDVTLSVDTTTIQQRVTGACTTGSKIRQINADGTVVCEPSAVTRVSSFGSDVTLTASEIGVVLVSGATLVTLPNPATVGSGASYTIKKVDAFGNIISIIGVVDSLSNEPLTEEGESLVIVSDGAAWRITGRYLPLNPIKPIVLYSAGVGTNGNLSGRPGADALCTSQRPPGYTKSRAFISVNPGDEIRDFPLTYDVPTNQPIRSTSDILIADDWADLLDGTIDTSLSAAGVTGTGGLYWTGSNGDGSLVADTCLGWTVGDFSANGVEGDAGSTSSSWLAGNLIPCFFSSELVCIAY